MIEEREQKRVQVLSYLKICYRDTDFQLGRVVDITTAGLRLCGAEPIQTNRTLTFKLTLPVSEVDDGEVVFDGDVIWCRRSRNPELYDTGIRIKDLPPEKNSIIAGFMEKTLTEDRWLSIIKSINGDI